eukprot:gb/GECG01009486.1/.p1 GENE.gb/GECG01009486.1/~~gb/GECG01009486.1/.p1  ORF type:complete len:700 (+),score=135.04 gb/GECG01009486.1/:1-2100(+)
MADSNSTNIQQRASVESDPLEKRLQEKREGGGKSAYYNQNEWNALIECLPRRHLRHDPTSHPSRENWPKLQVRQTSTPPRSQSPSERLQTAPSSPASTRSSGRPAVTQSQGSQIKQIDSKKSTSSTVPVSTTANQIFQTSPARHGQEGEAELPPKDKIGHGSSMPRTGGTLSSSLLNEEVTEGTAPRTQIWGHSWWPIPESAIERQHAENESIQKSLSTSMLGEQGDVKNRLKAVNVERSSQERKNPRQKTQSEAEADATIVKLSANPSLVNKTTITQLKMYYRLPDAVARRLKRDAHKEIKRREEVAKQRHEQSEQKLKEFQAEWEEKLARAREAQIAKKEHRFNTLMGEVDEGWSVLQDIKDRVLKKEASKEYEQTRQLHDQWNASVHERIRKSIANHYESGSLAKRRQRRRKQYETYLRAFGHENLSQYDPLSSRERPIKVGYISDPIHAALSKTDDEERALYEDPSSPEQKKRQEAAQKIFFDHVPEETAERRKPSKNSSSKSKKQSSSKADAMDLVERVRMAEKEEADDRRWTLPPLLWSSGVINDTTYVRQYKTMDEFTSSKEGIDKMVVEEEQEAEKERTRLMGDYFEEVDPKDAVKRASQEFSGGKKIVDNPLAKTKWEGCAYPLGTEEGDIHRGVKRVPPPNERAGKWNGAAYPEGPTTDEIKRGVKKPELADKYETSKGVERTLRMDSE